MILKLLLLSGLLTAFYFLFLRDRVPHGVARLFLLGILPVSLALSLARFEGGGMGISFASLTQTPRYEMPLGTTAAAEPPNWLAIAVYASGIIALIAFNIRQLALLKSLRRGAVSRAEYGIRVWCGSGIKAPFSAFRSIYLPAGLAPERRKIVLCHEKQHIVHRHYIDLAVMEFFALAAWFVPFVWIVRRELRQVHEFEADRATMAAGVPMHDLMAAILAETAGLVPRAANPFGSFTKKRFQQMKTFKNRWSALRGAAALPFVAILALFFAAVPATKAQKPSKEAPVLTMPTPEMEREMAKYQRKIAKLELKQQALAEKMTAKQNELIKEAKETARANGQLRITYRAR